jgi:Zn2+/Cd2+-exporting ATPase
LLRLTAALESKSTHPIALAVTAYAGKIIDGVNIEQVEEVAGHGLRGVINGKTVLAGNASLMRKYKISYDPDLEEEKETVVMVAINQQYAGYLLIADEIKADARKTISALHQLNISTVMLSGDKTSVVENVARSLGIDEAYGALLPEEKVQKVAALKEQGKHLAFMGDGVNDAPVVALADVGIAMGGLGSDATIETADVVIQNDKPYKLVTAIKIGRLTKNVVWQNIALAMGVKILVLILGAGGIANLWEAVIADVGVALLAILNAVRIQRTKVE